MEVGRSKGDLNAIVTRLGNIKIKSNLIQNHHQVPGYPGSTYNYLIYGHFSKIIIRYQGTPVQPFKYLIYGHSSKIIINCQGTLVQPITKSKKSKSKKAISKKAKSGKSKSRKSKSGKTKSRKSKSGRPGSLILSTIGKIMRQDHAARG